jgi:hypothetical protein
MNVVMLGIGCRLVVIAQLLPSLVCPEVVRECMLGRFLWCFWMYAGDMIKSPMGLERLRECMARDWFLLC